MIINSILDNDLYNFSTQAAILSLYSGTHVTYEFVNRRESQKFNKQGYHAILDEIQSMANLEVKKEEIRFLRRTCPFLPEWYLVWLKNYKFDPNEVKISWNEETGKLTINPTGLWDRTVLWEVPILAIVDECYFKYVDTNWTYEGQREKIRQKGEKLNKAECKVSDFGTRRRRNLDVQMMVVEELSKFDNFIGSSNPFMAMTFPKLKNGQQHNPKGTMSHQWIMAHQYFGGIRHCNKYAMEAWQKVFNGQLGIALTDTIGSDTFFNDVGPIIARSFDGTRHDSGPFDKYVEKTINFYRKFDINPLSKSIVFSDGLNTDLAIEIKEYCKDKTNCGFGIGTHNVNDFDNSPAMNIVMKLRTVNGVPVVKLSDVTGKAIGDPEALKVTNWIVNQKYL